MNALEPIERALLRLSPEPPPDLLTELETVEPDINEMLSDLELGFMPEDWGDGSEPDAATLSAMHAAATPEQRAALELPRGVLLRSSTPPPIVKLKRVLHTGMKGRDVGAMQRCLKAANVRKGDPSGHFRKPTRMQVLTYQRRHGLHADGAVGPKTWASMARYMDGYTRWLVQHTVIRKPITDEIDHFIKVAWWYYVRRPHHYLQQRPMEDTGPPPNDDEYLDCSEYVYVCAKAGGLPDPSGLGYSNYGNTDSFLQHMRHTWSPQRGDLALYSNPGHVTIITGFSDAYGAVMCLSNGSDGGPLFIPVHYRSPVAYLTWRTS